MVLAQQTKAWLILGAVFVLVLLLNIDYSAVNLILVDISKEFDEDLNILQWLLSAYTLAWGSTSIIGGRLSDIYGKRCLFFIGVSAFAASSLMCGIGWSTWVLIVGRILQGVAGGLFVAPLYAMIFTVFPESKRGFAIGMLGLAAGMGLAFGPSLGGFLLEVINWRWVFFVNVPLCILSLFVVWCFGEKETIEKTGQKIDIQGAALLSSSLILLMFTLNQTEVWGVSSLPYLVSLGTSVFLFATFYLTQRSKKERLIPKGFFANMPYLGCLVGFSLFEYVFATIFLIINLYLQNVLQYSAYESGLIFFSMTLLLGGFAPFGGKLCDKMDGRIPICLGLFIVGICCVWLSTFNSSTDLMQLIVVLALTGTGLGLAFPAFNTIMMETVDGSLLNTASGVFALGCTLSLSLGVVISSSLLTGLGQYFLEGVLPIGTTVEQKASVMTYLSSAYHDVKELNLFAEPQMINNLVNQAYTQAMSHIMIITAGVAFISAFFSYVTVKGYKK